MSCQYLLGIEHALKQVKNAKSLQDAYCRKVKRLLRIEHRSFRLQSDALTIRTFICSAARSGSASHRRRNRVVKSTFSAKEKKKKHDPKKDKPEFVGGLPMNPLTGPARENDYHYDPMNEMMPLGTGQLRSAYRKSKFVSFPCFLIQLGFFFFRILPRQKRQKSTSWSISNQRRRKNRPKRSPSSRST